MEKIRNFVRLIECATGASECYSLFVTQNEAATYVVYATELYKSLHVALLPLGTGKIQLHVMAFCHDDSHVSYDVATRFDNLAELLNAINEEGLKTVCTEIFSGCSLLKR